LATTLLKNPKANILIVRPTTMVSVVLTVTSHKKYGLSFVRRFSTGRHKSQQTKMETKKWEITLSMLPAKTVVRHPLARESFHL
jgi:hypothetical protein